MSIQKSAPNYLKHQESPYTNVINETMALIPCAAALGIYVYLLSKPENWEIQVTELMRRFSKGRDFIKGCLEILKGVGLYKVSSVRDSAGKITSWETVLYKYVPNQITENPSSGASQITEKPESGETRIWKTPPLNKERDLIKKEKSTYASPPESPKAPNPPTTRSFMRSENQELQPWEKERRERETADQKRTRSTWNPNVWDEPPGRESPLFAEFSRKKHQQHQSIG